MPNNKLDSNKSHNIEKLMEIRTHTIEHELVDISEKNIKHPELEHLLEHNIDKKSGKK